MLGTHGMGSGEQNGFQKWVSLSTNLPFSFLLLVSSCFFFQISLFEIFYLPFLSFVSPFVFLSPQVVSSIFQFLLPLCWEPKVTIKLISSYCFSLFQLQQSVQFSLTCHLSFSYFEFKIRLIRQGLSFQKQKFLYLNLQPTDSQSGVITITPKSQLWVRDTEKLSVTFSHTWLILVEFN